MDTKLPALDIQDIPDRTSVVAGLQYSLAKRNGKDYANHAYLLVLKEKMEHDGLVCSWRSRKDRVVRVSSMGPCLMDSFEPLFPP